MCPEDLVLYVFKNFFSVLNLFSTPVWHSILVYRELKRDFKSSEPIGGE